MSFPQCALVGTPPGPPPSIMRFMHFSAIFVSTAFLATLIGDVARMHINMFCSHRPHPGPVMARLKDAKSSVSLDWHAS